MIQEDCLAVQKPGTRQNLKLLLLLAASIYFVRSKTIPEGNVIALNVFVWVPIYVLFGK
jgi:hypothetical protein